MSFGRSYETLGEVAIKDVLPYVGCDRHSFLINGQSCSISMESMRYKVFKKRLSCTVCGVYGVKFLAQRNIGSIGRYHLNLYGEDPVRGLILMTKDHIVPKARGGVDSIENYQTMCHLCNEIKGCKDIPHAEILRLRAQLQ